MRVGFGSVVLGAGLSAILSFSFLALAVGTEYWYIIEDKRTNHTELQHVHSGLWGVGNGKEHFYSSKKKSSSSLFDSGLITNLGV